MKNSTWIMIILCAVLILFFLGALGFDWLKENGLKKDIVVVGGGVRDAYVGRRLNDIDISIAIPLKEEERRTFLGTTSQANSRVYKYAMRKLKLLSENVTDEFSKFFE